MCVLKQFEMVGIFYRQVFIVRHLLGINIPPSIININININIDVHVMTSKIKDSTVQVMFEYSVAKIERVAQLCLSKRVLYWSFT